MIIKVFIMLLLCITISSPAVAQESTSMKAADNSDYASAKIISVNEQKLSQTLSQSLGANASVQKVTLKVESGPYKGKIIHLDNQLSANKAYDIKVKPKDHVLLDVEPTSKTNATFYLADFYRIPALIVVFIAFLASMILISGKKGVKSIVSIFSTFSLIAFILIPSITGKLPLIAVTLAVCTAATVIAIISVSGFNMKSLSAILGTLCGLFIAGLVALYALKFGYLTGFHDQESIILESMHPELNFRGLLASSMLISSLGAIMDIGISIASSIYEIHQTNEEIGFKKLYQSGMNIGSDITGAMANTLILAYIGGSLPLAVLASSISPIKFLSLNSISTEIFSALAGSIGIVLCVPATAAISGYMFSRKNKFSDLESLKNNTLDNEINS
ncbi:MAG: YibE/F family protein [bacterium]